MKEKLKNKKVIYTIIGIVSVLLVALAVTYAYWLVTKTQSNENVISSACLDIAISGEKNDITLTNQFPMSDEDGMKLVPYEFTVTNNCNTSVDYQVALEAIGEESSSLKTSSMKVALNDVVTLLSDNEEVVTTIDGAYESRKLLIDTLVAKGTAAYELRLWIDVDAPVSENNKTFTSKISVSAGEGIKKQSSVPLTFKEMILVEAKEKGYFYSNSPNFSSITGDGQYGLYSLEDDYGISYYFRGDVENNYVELGSYSTEVRSYFVNNSFGIFWHDTLEECHAAIDEGAPWSEEDCQETTVINPNDKMYWRIVRINGDGTIRLMYDGTSAVGNGLSGTGFWMRSGFNDNYINGTRDKDPKYIGYTYEDGTGNQTDSEIKAYLDNWYTNYIKNELEIYLADSIYCNDRNDDNVDYYYAAYDRLSTNKKPTLKCTNKDDRYTVNDTVKGNGLLTYPVGLLTADEAAVAGSNNDYLNDSTAIHNYFARAELGDVWTMTPSFISNQSGAEVWDLQSNGHLHSINVVSDSKIIRPVINLKADVEFTGDGTIDNPYKIVTE